MLRTLLCAGAAAVALAAGAAAQNPGAAPTHGLVNLRSNFQPDPYVHDVAAGGNVDAGALGAFCRGTISDAPNLNVVFQTDPSNSWPLIIGADSDTDVTLVVRGPNGQYTCDDDGGEGLNSRIEFSDPMSGTYNVWVGTYVDTASLGSNPPARVYVSEIPEVTSAGGFGGGVDLTAEPTFGEVTLNTGFTPDPHLVSLASGGPVDASVVDPANCWGYINGVPDYRLTYTAGTTWPLIIAVRALDDPELGYPADMTLAVSDPNGQWHCNDDGGPGLNPRLIWPAGTAPSGVYDIFVGTYGGPTFHPADLIISELESAAPGNDGAFPDTAPPLPPTPTGPVQNPNMRPNIGLPAQTNINLTNGFTPDPNVSRVQMSGPIDARIAIPGQGCAGYISEAPQARLNYQAGGWPLIISVDSLGDDATLVVNDPYGAWHCNDDGGEALFNPSLRFDTPTSGAYSIWVGRYGDPSSAPADLHISEVGTQ